jgi:hypothetical protein
VINTLVVGVHYASLGVRGGAERISGPLPRSGSTHLRSHVFVRDWPIASFRLRWATSGLTTLQAVGLFAQLVRAGSSSGGRLRSDSLRCSRVSGGSFPGSA